MFLRQERNMAVAGVDALLSGLSALNGQMVGVNIARSKFTQLFAEWKKEDVRKERVKQAQVFSVVEDLPWMYKAVFKVQKWTTFFATMIWTMLLIMACVLGRASCVTLHCPLIEHIEFPSGPGGYDLDGIPKKTFIAWLDWKHRKHGINTKCFIAIHRNYTDVRFCPVIWLLRYLSFKRELGHEMTGPLFDVNLDSDKLQKRLKTLFKHAAKMARATKRAADKLRAAVIEKCSSHSIRRTFAQHGARCNAPDKVLQDVGRWQNIAHMTVCVGQGLLSRDEAIEESLDNVDSVRRVWFWRSYVRKSEGGEHMRR